jgi:hypothetical protein
MAEPSGSLPPTLPHQRDQEIQGNRAPGVRSPGDILPAQGVRVREVGLQRLPEYWRIPTLVNKPLLL